MRTVVGCILGVLAGGGMAGAAAQPPPAAGGPIVTCDLIGDARQRTFVLSRLDADGTRLWHLSFRSAETAPRWLRLKLPGAAPSIEAARASLDYRSPNGGVIVKLKVEPESSSIDVYVSYELEVNVDFALEPEIDELNTDGALTDVRCTVETAAK